MRTKPKSPVVKITLEKGEIEKLQKGIEILKLDPENDFIFLIKPDSKPTYTEIILDKLGLSKLETELKHDPQGNRKD
jgi:hypothetical protein